MPEVVVKVDMAKYKHVDLPADEAIKFLETVRDLSGKNPDDVREAIRYIRNFDEFYEYMRRKFKDYIAPPHKPSDYIKGLAFIDKVKLYRTGEGEKRVLLVFDRRVNTKLLEEALERLGYQVRVQRAF